MTAPHMRLSGAREHPGHTSPCRCLEGIRSKLAMVQASSSVPTWGTVWSRRFCTWAHGTGIKGTWGAAGRPNDHFPTWVMCTGCHHEGKGWIQRTPVGGAVERVGPSALMVLNSLSSSDLPAVSGVASAFRGHAGRRLTVRGKTAAAPGLAGGERRSMAEQLELLLHAQERCNTSIR